jgi:hypothetical protein
MKEVLETHEQMPNQQTLYCESMSENECFIHNKRETFKEMIRKRRRNESLEQRQKRLNQMKQYAKRRRASENPEERQKRLSQMNNYARQRRANESLDQRIKRLSQMNNYAKQRRANETPEQREERKRKRRELQSLRRNNETPEERQRRLSKMNKYAKQRRADESLQQSERQLSQINDYGNQETLSEGYEREEEQNMQEKETLKGTNETPEQQEKWWKQQDKDAQRRVDATPKLLEECCIQEKEMCALQETYDAVEQKQMKCMEKQDEWCIKRDMKVVLHKTNNTPEQHEERYRQQHERDAERGTDENPEVYDHCRQQQKVFALQRRNMTPERKQDWHMQEQNEWCRQDAKITSYKTNKNAEQLEERCR